MPEPMNLITVFSKTALSTNILYYNWSNNEYTKPDPCDILEERQEFVGIAGENDEKLTA
ncbi:MAG: hypothetical protein ACI4FO_08900 [Acutalibacteraceae bacterium]